MLGLVVGGALTGLSWRLAFLVNVPIGLLVIYPARSMLSETQKERTRLDAAGALLATLTCTAAVFGISMGRRRAAVGPDDGPVLAAVTASGRSSMVERTADNPIVPFGLFCDRNRLATFAAMFLARGVSFTMTVLLGLYVQRHHGLQPAERGHRLHPFRHRDGDRHGRVVAAGVEFSPRVMVIAGGILVLCAMLYCSTLNGGIPYFPTLVLPIVVGVIGLGLIGVPLALSLIASVGATASGRPRRSR